MNRIDSASLSAHALLDIQKAQQELHAISQQSGSQKPAQNVKDYGHDTQWLVSSQSLLTRIEAKQEQTGALQTRLELQDLALDQASSAVQNLKNAALEALALDSGETLVPALEEAFSVLTASLNLRHNGQYLFGGTLHDQPPIKIDSLDQLLAGQTADALESESAPHRMRLDEAEIITAPQGSDLARPVFEVLHVLGQFHAGPNGPFSHPLTTDQETIIQEQLAALDTGFDTVLQAQADNGRLLKRTEDTAIRLGIEHDTLGAAIGERTEVDLAEIAVRLSEAQIAYQASASVFSSLRDLTLLDIL